jgi:hypothetical protein
MLIVDGYQRKRGTLLILVMVPSNYNFAYVNYNNKKIMTGTNWFIKVN